MEDEECKSPESVKKVLAPSHMSFVKPLTHYNENDIQRKLSVGSGEAYSPYLMQQKAKWTEQPDVEMKSESPTDGSKGSGSEPGSPNLPLNYL